jgi:hypothetical protein
MIALKRRRPRNVLSGASTTLDGALFFSDMSVSSL